nr:COX15/CtaA family protein [Chloroflexota bacterium]
MTRLFRLALLAVLSAYALIVLGGITRISGSGMGCADDWPRCHGKWYPPLDLQSIIEYSHRTIAAYIGLLVLVIAVMAFRAAGTSARTRWTALVGLVLVVIQALLGAVTVFRELPASIVTAHLGTAMLFLATTMLTALFIAQDRGGPDWLVGTGRVSGPPPDRRFALVAQAGALVIFFLILSGGLTSTSGAALACGDWPLCLNGTLVPANANEYTWIHISHRLMALLAVITVTLVATAAVRWRVSSEAKRLAEAAVKIIIVQVLIGASYIWTEGNGLTAVAHLATATLLWAVLVALVVVARRGLVGQEITGRGHETLRPSTVGTMSGTTSLPTARM